MLYRYCIIVTYKTVRYLERVAKSALSPMRASSCCRLSGYFSNALLQMPISVLSTRRSREGDSGSLKSVPASD